MGSNEHFTEWAQKQHEKDPKGTGCLWRHFEDYEIKKYPRCSYRKNAHDHSKAAEGFIYAVPSFRSPERWVQAWLDRLEPTMTKARPATGSKPAKPSKEIAGTRPADPMKGEWALSRGDNFKDWKKPFWHNTHHVIACGEIMEAFPLVKEQKLLVATKWNINEMPNVLILPKQYAVARILKLPTHVPPDGPAEHENYSTRLGVRLNGIKAKLSKNKSQGDHRLTDETAPGCRTELEKASAAIRKFLIECGEQNPGVNLDNLKLDSGD